jgi:hypothetical protein
LEQQRLYRPRDRPVRCYLDSQDVRDVARIVAHVSPQGISAVWGGKGPTRAAPLRVLGCRGGVPTTLLLEPAATEACETREENE